MTAQLYITRILLKEVRSFILRLIHQFEHKKVYDLITLKTD